MPSLHETLRVYQELADWHEQHGPPQVRDRFLILAADAALSAGREDEADRLRHRLLQLNPHHLLRPFASFAESLCSPDVRNYVSDLRQNYPPEVAQELRQEIRDGNSQTEARSTLALPPTLPVVKIDPPEREERSSAPDAAVVYWNDPKPNPVPAPKPKPAKRPPAAKQPARPPAAPPPPGTPAPVPGKLARLAAAKRETYRLRPDPVPMHSTPAADPEDDEQPRASWVSLGLFGLVLVLGVGLMVYTLVRPFLPAQGLP